MAHREEATNESVWDTPADKQDTKDSMLSSGALGCVWSVSVPKHYLRKQSAVWQLCDLWLRGGLVFCV